MTTLDTSNYFQAQVPVGETQVTIVGTTLAAFLDTLQRLGHGVPQTAAAGIDIRNVTFDNPQGAAISTGVGAAEKQAAADAGKKPEPQAPKQEPAATQQPANVVAYEAVSQRVLALAKHDPTGANVLLPLIGEFKDEAGQPANHAKKIQPQDRQAFIEKADKKLAELKAKATADAGVPA